MARLPAPLVQAAMDGDQAATLRLLEAARPDIRRYARSACRANDVDDAVHEALWLLYRRVGTLRALSSLSGWLVTVVRRECLRLSRALAPAVEAPAEGRDPLAQGDHALRLDLAAAIQSLPEQYRTVVVLRDLEERSIDEMTCRLGLSREAVKGRLHWARLMLREYLLR